MKLREATPADLAQAADVCNAAGRAPWTKEMLAPQTGRAVLVAVQGNRIVGIAKTHFYPEPDGTAPAGHYLGGVLVLPAFRRQGVGSHLTRARLDWIKERSARAYYFANEHNAASIRMHEAMGFRPIARLPQIHGVNADEGRSELVLFECAP